MKNRTFYFSLFLLLFSQYCHVANAQSYLGIQGGIGTISYDEYSGVSASIKITYERCLWKTTYLHVGLGLEIKDVGEGLFKFDYMGNYWDLEQLYVPVLFKFVSKNEHKTRAYLDIGGSVGNLYKTKFTKLNGVEGSMEFENMEYNLIMGAGLNIDLDNGLLFIGLQHRRGLNDLTDSEDEYNLKINTTDFIHIGFLFDLARL